MIQGWREPIMLSTFSHRTLAALEQAKCPHRQALIHNKGDNDVSNTNIQHVLHADDFCKEHHGLWAWNVVPENACLFAKYVVQALITDYTLECYNALKAEM